MSTFLKVLALLLGLALLGWMVSEFNFTTVADAVLRVGVGGAVVIILLFAVGFTADVGAWGQMFEGPVSRLWLWRLWLVQMVGEAVSVLMPFGALGGEPVKAMLLKKRYDVSYREASASLFLIQAMNTLGEIPFIAIGLVGLLHRGILPANLELIFTGGVIWLAFFTCGVFVALHLRMLVSLQRRLLVSRWGARLSRGLDVLGDIEVRLFTFIRHRPARFFTALVLAFANWTFGALETFVILRLLGVPVDLMDAWMLETCVVLVRNVTFFVPGHFGTQEGIIVLIGGMLTGSPETALALALVKRARELVWSGAGLIIGGWFGLKPPAAADVTP